MGCLQKYYLLGAIISLLSVAASAQMNSAVFSIEQPQVLATAPGQNNSALYFHLKNQSKVLIEQVSVRSKEVAEIELHQTLMQDGQMQMRPITKLSILPEQSLVFEPNGLHFMLMGLKQQLKAGATLALTVCVLDDCQQVNAKIIHPMQHKAHHH